MCERDPRKRPKKSVALVAAAMGGLLACGSALAQSNVTIYGIIDVGIDISDNGHGSQFRAQSGQSAGTRLGFKGEEALGNGLKAIWVLEQGLAIDNAANTVHGTNSTSLPGVNTNSGANLGSFFQRQAYGGLSSNFGTITIGRQYTPFFHIKRNADAFNMGLSPTINNIYAIIIPGGVDRFDNAIFYNSPNLSGLTFGAVYSAGNENNTDDFLDKAGRAWSLMAQYNNGGLWVGGAYNNMRGQDPLKQQFTLATDVAKTDAWMLGASYDFTVAKIYGSYGQGKTKLSGGDYGELTKRRVWSIAGSLPLGRHTLKASYAHMDDRKVDNADFTVYGLGYEYAFSKRTALYAAYGRGENESGRYGLPLTAVTNGLTNTSPGKDVYSFNLGVRHTF